MGAMVVALGFLIMGCRKSPSNPKASTPEAQALLKKFIEIKDDQFQTLTRVSATSPSADYQRFFQLGRKSKYGQMRGLFQDMASRSGQYADSKSEDKSIRLSAWQTVLEVVMASDLFCAWNWRDILQYNHDVIEAMETPCIYFGGTDPGRTLPTVFVETGESKRIVVLTQNPLADQTYMDYIRFVHGAKITLPSGEDFNKVFNDLVQARNQKPNSGFTLERDPTGKGMRASVSGPEAVFAINGALAQWIFEKNKDHFSFYLEESYPMDWIYDHAVPSGPILKLNKDPLKGRLDKKLVEKDTAFWNARVKELMGDPRSLLENVADRVVSARAAYSKMRTAIARLYDHHGMTEEADYALKQALQLCPGNREATDLSSRIKGRELAR